MEGAQLKGGGGDLAIAGMCPTQRVFSGADLSGGGANWPPGLPDHPGWG